MDAQIWGPVFWNLLFDVAHFYRGNYSELVGDFFLKTKYVLPCETCRKHYDRFVGKDIQHREDIGLDILYPLRNEINFRLLKPTLPLKTYRTRREFFPLVGNYFVLKNIFKIIWKTVIFIDVTYPQTQAREWCMLAVTVTQSIPGYGFVEPLDCRKALSTSESTETMSSDTANTST